MIAGLSARLKSNPGRRYADVAGVKLDGAEVMRVLSEIQARKKEAVNQATGGNTGGVQELTRVVEVD